ncbi:MAG: sigma-70 family RNA polymerase sigma factor [Acidobacteria bacterium]|nr:sigma-70 family RNA polymerase sigma factor [Acidobacteriota bacterium]
MLFGKRDPYKEFEEAALPHLDELYRSARRMLRDHASAEDVVQETYLRAWRSFARFEKGTNCRAWLFRIMVNCSRDYWKRRAEAAPADRSEEILDQQAATPSMPARLTDPGILGALHNVPYKLREVIVLADVEEFTYREIAGLLDVPIGTVMSRLSRGRSRLRELLSESSGGRSAGSGRGTA